MGGGCLDLDQELMKSRTRKVRIPSSLISATEGVLRSYGEMSPPHESIVYWGGIKLADRIEVRSLHVPRAETDKYRVVTNHHQNSRFVSDLSRLGLTQIAQVHSHPTDWVGHSYGDSAWAAFRTTGLLSIVVPEYCRNGMLPLTRCGVHRFEDRDFIRLPKRYITQYIEVVGSNDFIMEDHRNEPVSND